ncbi:hypothetical protein V6Z11_A09G031600 [Gossypium hirsutum]|uniref:Uncharacterized protein isoform X1 n=1 Tax=Gossypium hirsutum TaxID=3635 RepID=A0ABM2YSE0_GOSHI|nr:uncharacterized protein LOC107942457 isoform X1 [Gossypium hirsutum]
MAKLRVTITGDGSSKVVKMGDDAMGGHRRMNGNRRFLQDKPWRNVGNRRRQINGVQWRSNGFKGQGSWIAGKDLRFKLMRKRGPFQYRDTFEDHRRNMEKPSNHIQPPQNRNKHMSETGPNRINNLNQISHNGITEVFQIYSLQTIDGSRGFPEMPKIIPTSLPRNELFPSNGIFNPSSEFGLMPGRGKAITSIPISHAAPISSIMQRKPRVDEEPFTVVTLLNSLGLGKYAIHFTAEEVDITALRQMGNRDLKELGIPMAKGLEWNSLILDLARDVSFGTRFSCWHWKF